MKSKSYYKYFITHYLIKMLRNIVRPASKKANKRIFTNELTQNQAFKFIHLFGYVILVFMVIDYAALLFPAQFLNPNWELNTIGKIIESIFVTLLGFMLVFFRPEKQSIKRSELRILSLLSWLALVLGIICFLFAPLLISNALRINSTNQTNISIQLTTQRQQAEQIKLQLDNLNETQLQNLWLRNQANSAANTNISAAEKKQQLTDKLNSIEQASRQQLQQRLKNQQRSLFKMTFKWVLGAIISGVTFVSLWKYTEWVREFLKAAKYEI